MTGIITSLPPLIEQPPGNNASNPAGLPGVVYTAAVPILPQTWTGLQTFQPGSMEFAGSTSGNTFLNASAIASGTIVLPAITGSDTLLTNNNVAVVTHKSIDGLTNTLTNIPAASFGSTTGTGAVVLNVGPSISGATITTSTYNGNTLTSGTGTLTLGAGKTATISNTLTFTGTDASSVAFGVGGTVAYTGTSLAQFAPTTSAQLAGVISDETGTGALVFANAPVLIGPALGTPISGVATNLTGTAAGLTAGNVTTNANLTGPVTSVGNATTIGANQVTRAMEAQGVARSVIGVTGNATANVADIQGTASQFLGVNSAGTAVAFQTMTTDVTLSGPAATISANAVTNAKMATMAAFTFKVNNTSGVATPTDITIDGLTLKASPAAGDEVFIWDVAGAALKKATVSGVGAAAGVSSIAGNTGAFTLAYPIGNVVNDIRYIGPADCGQLTFTSTAALAFKPYKGDTLKINGVVMQIPSAGIAGLGAPTSVFLNGVAAQTLVAATTYFIYAFSNAGTVTADFSTTGHSASATAGNVGIEIKTGDDTRSLIGMVRTGATVIYASDLQTASWFNRRPKVALQSQSVVAASTTVASTAISFVTWATDAFMIMCYGGVTSSAGPANTSHQNRLDGSTVGASSGILTASGATFGLPVSISRVMTSTEGNHSFDTNITGTATTATFTGESYVQING
jgi:hypothetical protein